MTLKRPSDEQLRAYLLGNVSADEQVAIAAFIDCHPEVISQLADAERQPDSLLADLRQPTDAFAGEPQFWMGLAQARSIRLGPSTRAADPEVEQFQSLPRRLGRYILQERINRRGMGVVYRAEDGTTGDSVVVKVLPISCMDDPAAITRFRREMELVGKLKHPYIVRFLDAGEADQTLFLVMEHLKGFDLSRLVELLGPLPLGAACSMARQTALALQHAFEQQLVHRDVKPSNIFLTNEGTVKLLDLGLARPLHVDEESLTHSGQLLGTVDYMAPEQAFDTHLADIRSDIYSLGCTLYKLLVGNAPFSGPEYRHLLKKALAHSSRPMVPIRDLRSEVPDELAKIIERMCAKAPEERFDTPKEVAEALAPFVDDSTLTSLVQQANTTAETQTPRRSEPTQRMGEIRRTATPGTHSTLHRLAAMIVLTLLAVCGAVAGWWAWNQSNDKPTVVTEITTPNVTIRPSTTGDRPPHWQLVGSGDFESGMAGWPAQDPNDPRDKGMFEQSSEKCFDGRCSACSIPIANFASEGFACISDEHPLVVGQKYVLSAAFETSGMTVGNLSLDLSDSGFNVRINALPSIKGWQFLWAEFVPNAPSIRVRLIRDGQLRKGERGFIDCVAITPAGEFVPDRDRALVSAKQATSYRETHRIVQDSPYSGIWCVHVSHDGRFVYTGSNDGGLRGWDLSTREQVLNLRRERQPDRPIHAFVFSKEENWCLAVGSPADVVRWNLSEKGQLGTFLGHTDRVWSVSLSPDGAQAATGSWDGTVRIWDVKSGDLLHMLEPQIGKVLSLSYSPNGKWLAAGGRAKAVLLDATTGESIRSFDGHTLYVNALTFTSDSQFLVTGARDNTVRLWNVTDGRQLRSFVGHASWVNAVAVSANNRLLLTGSADRTVRLWDLATGEPLRLFLGHEAPVNAVAFVHNRPEAVSGSDDQTIRTWPIPVKDDE